MVWAILHTVKEMLIWLSARCCPVDNVNIVLGKFKLIPLQLMTFSLHNSSKDLRRQFAVGEKRAKSCR